MDGTALDKKTNETVLTNLVLLVTNVLEVLAALNVGSVLNDLVVPLLLLVGKCKILLLECLLSVGGEADGAICLFNGLLNCGSFLYGSLLNCR